MEILSRQKQINDANKLENLAKIHHSTRLGDLKIRCGAKSRLTSQPSARPFAQIIPVMH